MVRSLIDKIVMHDRHGQSCETELIGDIAKMVEVPCEAQKRKKPPIEGRLLVGFGCGDAQAALPNSASAWQLLLEGVKRKAKAAHPVESRRKRGSSKGDAPSAVTALGLTF